MWLSTCYVAKKPGSLERILNNENENVLIKGYSNFEVRHSTVFSVCVYKIDKDLLGYVVDQWMRAGTVILKRKFVIAGVFDLLYYKA